MELTDYEHVIFIHVNLTLLENSVFVTILCTYILFACMSEYHMWALRGQKKALDPLELDLQMALRPGWCQEYNFGPEEQSVLLATESSL